MGIYLDDQPDKSRRIGREALASLPPRHDRGAPDLAAVLAARGIVETQRREPTTDLRA